MDIGKIVSGVMYSFPTKTTKTTESNEDEVTQYSSYAEAVKASADTIDTKAEALLSKANAGEKLSDAELEYLSKKCPDAYAKIKAALAEREALEQEMKASKSKLGVTGSYVSHLSDVKKTSEDGYEMQLRCNQLSNAHDSYVKTEEYKKKDDEEKQSKRIREKVKEDKEKFEDRIEDKNVAETETADDDTILSGSYEKSVPDTEKENTDLKATVDEKKDTEPNVLDVYKNNTDKENSMGLVINKSI